MAHRKLARRRNQDPSTTAQLAVILAGIGAVGGAAGYAVAKKSAATGALVGAVIGLSFVLMGEIEERVRG